MFIVQFESIVHLKNMKVLENDVTGWICDISVGPNRMRNTRRLIRAYDSVANEHLQKTFGRFLFNVYHTYYHTRVKLLTNDATVCSSTNHLFTSGVESNHVSSIITGFAKCLTHWCLASYLKELCKQSRTRSERS